MALLNGWLNKNYKKNKIIVIETNSTIRNLLKNKGINCYESLDVYAEKQSNLIIIFAVKPQSLEEVLINLKKIDFKNTLYLSIVAGVRVDYLTKYLGEARYIYRAMPNIPAEVLEGVTAIFKNNNSLKKDSFFVENLMSSVGQSIWVESEKDIDIVTAISGSGPAYFFYLTECLIKICTLMGLNRDLSEKLSVQTMIGSAALLKVTNKSPETLRNNVTSKGGTTEAAIRALKNNDAFEEIVRSAVSSAKKRSEELSKNS